ncbi:hypothetical protein BJ165DRAFT_1533917 [Panaeolus papilionaceus]|nr:hypothetical protein BJ165DRAFT_1533917 [Panaeolus papilionaceus]
MSTIPDFATRLKYIEVLGPVSVERASNFGPRINEGTYLVFVLLGPTGSGKSSFIEAVASNPSLGLSSDKLEGFTQSVSIYRIINVGVYDSPIYLVDVPGFADSKVSAMSIVSMLKDMIQTNPTLWTFRILYHTPINNPRLPGSQRRVLRTFEALTGTKSAGNITVVSTMWDSIWNESGRRRAKGNFSQLRDEIWKNYIAEGADIFKFHNTQESALTILDGACDRGRGVYFKIQDSIDLPLRETPFASYICDDLQARIHDLQLQQASIQSELQTVTEQSDKELKAILIAQLEEVQTLFTKFEEELRELGTPSDRLATLKPIPPTDNPAAPTPGPFPTPGPLEPVPEPLALAHGVVTPAGSEPVTLTPDSKSPKGGIFTRATNRVRGWGNKPSKHKVSD